MNRFRAGFYFAIAMAALAAASVTITESTPRRLSFVWTLDDYTIQTNGASAGAVSSIEAMGTNVSLGEFGDPAVPGYSFLVGIPPNGLPAVSIVPLESKTVRLSAPLAVVNGNPKLVRRPGLTFVNQWISSMNVSWLGRLRNAHYIIRPFVYEKNALVVSVLTRATVTIDLPPVTGKTEQVSDRSEFNRMVARLVLNYPVSRNWAASRSARLARRTAAPDPFTTNNKLISFAIGDGHAGFNEGTTNENGLLKITGQTILTTLGVSSARIGDVALFGSVKGELNPLMPDSSSFPAGVVPIPLLRVDVNHDGNLDNDDYVIAFVTGNSDWAFDTAGAQWHFNLNRYDDYRHYWLGLMSSAALTMPHFTCSSQPSNTLIATLTPLMLKKSRMYPSDGREGTIDWVWDKLTNSSPQFTASFDTAMILRDSAISMLVEPGYNTFPSGVNGIRFGDSLIDTVFTASKWYRVPPAALVKPVVQLDFQAPAASSDQPPYAQEIKSLQFRYWKRLDLSTAVSTIAYAPVESGVVQYRLSGVPLNQELFIVRVPADESKASVVLDTTIATGNPTVSWTDSTGTGVRYYIATANGLLPSPQYTFSVIPAVPFNSDSIKDLRNTGNYADYLVVYHPDFVNAAAALVQHKQSLGRFQSVRMVNINDVYRQFSGGNVDPSALRNFLFFAFNFWSPQRDPQLTYVIFVGNGNFDYKGILNKQPSYIPLYEFGDGTLQKCYEDFFSHLWRTTDSFATDSTSIFLGRLPCASDAEATAMVDKIREAEDPASADFGAWRNRVLLVADDDMQGSKPDPLESSTPHYRSSELVARTILRQCPAVDLRKIYLFDYDLNAQYEKPGAERALINEVNNGVSIVNWFGHGAEDLWADEHILTKNDMSGFTNRKKYPVINSFSCSVGKFDNPDPEATCLSTMMVRLPSAGGIAAISSTRVAYAESNEVLAKDFYGLLFDSTAANSLGQAYLLAKELESNSNFQSYALLGDPSYRSPAPTHRVRLTIVDGKNKPTDTLSALERVTVRGSIMFLDTSHGYHRDTLFGSKAVPASVQISLFNPPSTAFHIGTAIHDTIRYPLPGIPLFLGQTQVDSGLFEQTILLPRNVAFGKTGAKLTAYAYRGTSMGLGYDTGIVFSGTKAASVNDTSGPVISIRPDYDQADHNAPASFQDGVTGMLPFKCRVDIYDENGIDVSGVGPDEGITMEIPGVLSRRSINNVFQFDQGNFQRGSAPYVFEEGQLRPGTYSLTLTAQDLLGNTAKRTFALTITDKDAFTLGHVFNYPNPMRMREKTKFFFYQGNTTTSWDLYKPEVRIRIYTMGGKLVRLIKMPVNGQEWDGCDEFLNPLSPNVYLYQVTARTTDGSNKTIKSPIMKLVIGPPRN